MSKANPARATFVVWLILAPAFLVLTYLAFSSNLGDASFALTSASLIMFITAAVVAGVYWARAKKLDSMFAGEGLLASWIYSPDEWRLYTEKEHQTDKRGRRFLFFVMSGFAALVGIIAIIADMESGIGVMAVMLAIIVIMWLFSWLTGRSIYQRNRKGAGVVYISKDGIYLNKQLHLWNHLGARLGSVKYVEETPPLLIFSYFAPTRTGLQEQQVRVPVPHEQQGKAQEILKQFGGSSSLSQG